MALDRIVACTLVGTELRAQRERWIDLGHRFGLEREETEDGLRLTFVNQPVVEQELQALVAVENECCRWASWSVEHDGADVLVMAARSRDEGVATLHGMFREAIS